MELSGGGCRSHIAKNMLSDLLTACSFMSGPYAGKPYAVFSLSMDGCCIAARTLPQHGSVGKGIQRLYTGSPKVQVGFCCCRAIPICPGPVGISKKHEELLHQLRMEEKHDDIKNGSAG